MAKMPKEVQDLFEDPESLKMLATVDKQKNLELIPLGTLTVSDADTLVFADVLQGKSRQNLEATKRATVTVFKGPMAGYQAKGVFTGWQTTGPAKDKYMAKAEKLLQNAGISEAPMGIGLIKLDEVFSISPVAGGMKVG